MLAAGWRATFIGFRDMGQRKRHLLSGLCDHGAREKRQVEQLTTRIERLHGVLPLESLETRGA